VEDAPAGTTIVLLPGRHQLGEDRNASSSASLDNVWLLGCGRDVTTLSAHLGKAIASRIEGVSLDCEDAPFALLIDGGSLHVRDCRVSGYNSGAGGSNAVFGVGTVLLVESCEFEGKSGRAGATMRGNAFDLRGDNHIFLRNTRFTDNQEIFRSADGVLDGCTIVSDQPDQASPPSGSALFVRNSTFTGSRAATGSRIAFTEALDDPGILDLLASGASPRRAFVDPTAQEAARALGAGNQAFWQRLLIHPDAHVRAIAHSASHLPAASPPAMTLDTALTKLDQAIIPAEAVLAILAASDAAQVRLAQLAREGSAWQTGNAQALLQLMTLQPSFSAMIRSEAARTRK
jgi:hypothetical protein